MKMNKKVKQEHEATLVLSPVLADTNRSISEIKQQAY
jgi:hypothetical protein